MRNNKIRACIYVYWDKNGRLQGFAKEFVTRTIHRYDRFVVVINGYLNDEGLAILKKLGAEVVTRENVGYDFYAYKAGLKQLGLFSTDESLLSEITLCNSSIYGPISSLDKIYNSIDPSIDFWGITQWKDSPPWPDHLQSYFVVFRERIINSPDFKKYWLNLPPILDWYEAVSKCETQMTQYFAKLGFRYTSYIDASPFKAKHANPTITAPFELLELGSPFVKRKAFTCDYRDISDETFGMSSRRSIEFIAHESDYPVSLIYDDLTDNYPEEKFHYQLHNTFVLDDNQTDSVKGTQASEIALVLYVYYSDLLEKCLKFINSMPKGATVYLVSPKPTVLELYKNRLNNCGYYIVSRLHENRGRNESAYFCTCSDCFKKFKYVCLAHDKKMANHPNLLLGESMLSHCFGCCLYSESYVWNVVNLFEKRPEIGLLIPPMPFQLGVYSALSIDRISGNQAQIDQLLNLIHISIRGNRYNFPVGSIFWVRSDALTKLLTKQWNLNDFPQEPIPVDGSILHAFERSYSTIVQASGYLTGVIIPKSLIAAYYDGLEYQFITIYSKYNDLLQSTTSSIGKPFVNSKFKQKIKFLVKQRPFLYKFAKRIKRLMES